MKKWLPILLLLTGIAMTPATDGLKRLQDRAKAEKKYISVYFSGSDWCAHCHYFDRHILQNQEIQARLQTQYIYYNADFPQRKQYTPEVQQTNEALADRLNPDGIFPLLVITDAQLNIQTRISKADHPDTVLQRLQQYAPTVIKTP